ncbi:hypothetical protein [Nocardia seriolae]|uniref:Membrane protein n=1 Tax=Nocardia seriolae TaxID=37332 RepID=A0ABC9YSX2_9NOCA|nr:hypothetical protein [Nocardia seriolae]APA96530.1 hypothetical protein NS506_02466 [Nocardia seriolae]WKY51130.1 hypothetical protein Q5P07_29865 [Nocardia seriolae]WNJ57810.1 hypothetical protein RMO66_31160 [Nocardia seriolae]BAW04944.1 conserved hypothetical protein [Nocardia seriolae]BEK90446.1 hypothetical protein NSERKGN1266_63970 [Nocardia seriolae]
MTDLRFPAAPLSAARPLRYGSVFALVIVGATAGVQVASFTVTGLSLICLLAVPGFALMSHRGVDLAPIVIAALAWISFLVSCLVNGVSVLWPNALALPAFGLYFIGFAVLTGRSIDAIASLLAGIAAGSVVFFLVKGIELTNTGRFLDLWKYGIAHAVTVLMVFALIRAHARPMVICGVLAVLALASLGLNFRSHALVCVVAAVWLATRHLLGARIGRGRSLAGVTGFGLLFAYLMPIAARAGLFGSALRRKTVEQDATHLPLLLAGRTEPPMTLSAIAERPLLGWGSAQHLTPELYARAEHLAIRIGFAPTFPFELYWRLPVFDYSAFHSILFGTWAEGGVVAALLPLLILVACAGVFWNHDRLGEWAPLFVLVALQGIWDLLYAPWTYNMIPELACLVLAYCAVHFRRAS